MNHSRLMILNCAGDAAYVHTLMNLAVSSMCCSRGQCNSVVFYVYKLSFHQTCIKRIVRTNLVTPEKSLRWRHNDHAGVSNHQPHGCLLNRLFRRRSKKTSKLRVTGLCEGNSPGPVNSPHKGPVTRKMFPFDDVIMIFSILTPAASLGHSVISQMLLLSLGCNVLGTMQAFHWVRNSNYSRISMSGSSMRGLDVSPRPTHPRWLLWQ